MDHAAERQHFRIVYPLKARPRLIRDGRDHVVLDCSERGLRYHSGGQSLPEVGDPIEGSLRFSRGEVVAIAGRVVRVQDATIALHLDLPGVPLATILDEQRFLRVHYPMHG